MRPPRAGSTTSSQWIAAAPPDCPFDQLLCDALLRVAADLPDRWELFAVLMHSEPELKAMLGAIDEANCEQLAQVVAARFGLAEDDIRVRMLATFATVAGRTCLEDWVLRGRPGGDQSFAAQLTLAFSIIDIRAFGGPGPVPTSCRRLDTTTCPRPPLSCLSQHSPARQPLSPRTPTRRISATDSQEIPWPPCSTVSDTSPPAADGRC